MRPYDLIRSRIQTLKKGTEEFGIRVKVKVAREQSRPPVPHR